MIVVSPHLDDAVLSCGEMLAEQDVLHHVLTVFTGGPMGELPLTTFDMHSGFVTPKQALYARSAEDFRAAKVLNFVTTHMPFWDRQYGRVLDEAALMAALLQVFTNARDDTYVVPLGVAHPDHEVVSRCTLEVIKDFGATVLIYEDLPGRVLYPEQVPGMLEAHRGRGWELELAYTPRGETWLKEVAIGCYRSQLWALDMHACLAPERYWRATWQG